MSRIKELERVYDKQLGVFMKDESYFADYADWKPRDGKLLVRIFVVKGEKSNIIAPENNIIGSTGPKMDKHQIKYPTNLAKVIKSGTDEVKEGSLITLPYSEVCGVQENPQMAAYLKASATKGAMAQKPLDTREFIPSLEISHRRKMVIKPGNLIPDEDDRYTYMFALGEVELINEKKTK